MERASTTDSGCRAGHWRHRDFGDFVSGALNDRVRLAIRKIDSFRGESAFASWLYRIVANAAYQRCRRRGGRVAVVSLDRLLPTFDEHGRHVAPVVDWSMAVDDPARQVELRMVLSAAIAELPAAYRVVEVLRD